MFALFTFVFMAYALLVAKQYFLNFQSDHAKVMENLRGQMLQYDSLSEHLLQFEDPSIKQDTSARITAKHRIQADYLQTSSAGKERMYKH